LRKCWLLSMAAAVCSSEWNTLN